MNLVDVIREATGVASPLAIFAVLWAASAAVLAIVFVAVGLAYEIVNRRRPDTKVQPDVHATRRREELASAPASIAIVAGCFAFGLFAQGMGWTMAPMAATWWSVPLWIGIGIVLYDAWFYWAHRLGHVGVFRRLHGRHHRSPTPTPWAHHSETIGDAILLQAFFALLPFVLPVPPIALILHKFYDQASGVVGHAGHEYFASALARAPWPLASTIFHDQHHSAGEVNFAHTFTLWDRWAGTLHPDYDRTVDAFVAADAARRAG